ncbi:MAG: saccharopine dehydrogenase family protein [Thermoplasmatota archaeon]
MPDFDILLYGATGYTGKLIARELDVRRASFAVAGRDRAKLESLSRVLASKPEVVVAPLDDTLALAAAAKRSKMVLGAAGPYSKFGAPVRSAALAAGVHYGDITGEQPFMLDTYGLDAAARDAGIVLVNGLGFDVVPSDFAASLAAKALGEPVDSLDLGIASNSKLSGGTKRSMAASGGAGGYWKDGKLHAAAPGRFARDFEFPAPLGNQRGVFIPWGDVATAPRSTGARVVRTFFTMPRARARSIRIAGPLASLGARIPFVRRRAEAAAAKASEGPSPEERARYRFSILAEAKSRDGRIARALVSGRDPYGLTGATAAEAALRIVRGEVKQSGALTPAQAFDVQDFLKSVDKFEVTARVL